MTYLFRQCRALLVVLCLLGLSLPILAQTGEVPVTVTETDGDAETVNVESGGYSYLGNNLVVLTQNTWKDAAWYLGKLVLVAVVAGLAMFLAGCLAGLVVWLLLRRRGWFATQWGWYRYVVWMWCPLFILSFGIGFGYAGANLGAGHVLKKGIIEERIVDRTVSQVYCAVAFDAADYKLNGEEKLEEIRAVLDQSEGLAKVVSSDMEKLVRDVMDDPRVQEKIDPRYRRWLDTVVNSRLGSMTFSKLTKEYDPRVVILLFYAISEGDESSRAFLEANPQASPLAAACTEMFNTIREQLCGLVNAVVYPNAAASLILGMGLPLGLMGLLRLVVRWTDKPKSTPTPTLPVLL